MGVLNGIMVHSASQESTWSDAVTAAVICLAIVIGIYFITKAIKDCITKIQDAKKAEADSRKDIEMHKIDKEYFWKERKDTFDSAWRTVQHYWKLEENREKESDKKNINIEKSQNQDAAETAAIQIDPLDKEREAKAWKYIEHYWSEGSVRSSEN